MTTGHALWQKKLKHTRIYLLNEIFSFSLWIDKGKPFNACTCSLLVSLKSQFQLMNNKVIRHDLENLPCYVEDFYCQLIQLGTCFAFLIHSTSTLLCSTTSMGTPDRFNNFFVRVSFLADELSCLFVMRIYPVKLMSNVYEMSLAVTIQDNWSIHDHWVHIKST